MTRWIGAVVCGCVAVGAAAFLGAAEKPKLVEAKDGSGVVGYKDTPVQPWSGYHVHDPDRPKPAKVDAGPGPANPVAPPPSDAVVLFDGAADLARWKPGHKWTVADGLLVAGAGTLTTAEEFGDCQLHVEWRAPDPPVGAAFDRGNNGVMMMGLSEIQVFDSFESTLYPDGQAGAVYAQTPPLVNPSRKAGQWQTYDIVWTAPRYGADGTMASPARVTMLYNGVAVHVNQEVYGGTPHRGLAAYPAKPVTSGPIVLMGHNNPVAFRNVWVRRLDRPAGPAAPAK